MIINNKDNGEKFVALKDIYETNKNTFLYTLSNKDVDYSKDTPFYEACSFLHNKCFKEIDNSLEIASRYIKFLKYAGTHPDEYNYEEFVSPFKEAETILINWKEVFKDDNEELSLEDLTKLFNNLFEIYLKSNHHISFNEKNICGLAFLLNNFKNNKDDAKKYLVNLKGKKSNSNFKFYLFLASLYYDATYSLDELKNITCDIDFHEINFDLTLNNELYRKVSHKIINNLFDAICVAMEDTKYLFLNKTFFSKAIDFCLNTEGKDIKDDELISVNGKLINKIIALQYFNSSAYLITLSQDKMRSELYSLIKEKGGYKHAINELDNKELKKFINSRKTYEFDETYVRQVVLGNFNDYLDDSALLIPILLLSINSTNNLNSNERLFSKRLEAFTIKIIASTSLEDIKMIFGDVPNSNILVKIKKIFNKYKISGADNLYDLTNCFLDEDTFPEKEIEDIYYEIYRCIPKLNKFFASLYRINNKL